MPFTLATWSAMVAPVLNGDLTGAKGTIICGILLGIVSGLADDMSREARSNADSPT